jgi:hypothetical protein
MLSGTISLRKSEEEGALTTTGRPCHADNLSSAEALKQRCNGDGELLIPALGERHETRQRPSIPLEQSIR